jgi:hypothetical protein
VEDINALHVNNLDTNLCKVCKERISKIDCYKCKKSVCDTCAANNNILTMFGTLECKKKVNNTGGSVQPVDPEREKGLSAVLLCNLFRDKMSDSSFISFLLFYILIGWAIDLMLVLTISSCVILFLSIGFIFYYTIFAPVYFIAWMTCLKRRRMCKPCGKRYS